MMHSRYNENVPFFHHWNGGRGGRNFSSILSQIVALEQICTKSDHLRSGLFCYHQKGPQRHKRESLPRGHLNLESSLFNIECWILHCVVYNCLQAFANGEICSVKDKLLCISFYSRFLQPTSTFWPAIMWNKCSCHVCLHHTSQFLVCYFEVHRKHVTSLVWVQTKANSTNLDSRFLFFLYFVRNLWVWWPC